MTALKIVAALVAAAAASDGISTNGAIHRGYQEIVRFTLFFYGTSRPSGLRILLTGSALVASEIALAFTLAHFVPKLGWVLVSAGLFQVGVHVYWTIHNRGLK